MSGPITLFDKSFLQSLSVDEAVWFDHFFQANISPFFYVESLADLKKAVKGGRTPEQEVSALAVKTPQMNGTPNVLHVELCLANLLGQEVEMDGRPVITRGRIVRESDRTVAVFSESPEAIAFSRWQDGKFLDVEREFASVWRSSLGSEDESRNLARVRGVGIDWKDVRTLADARAVAEDAVRARRKATARFKLMLSLLRIPRSARGRISQRWRALGSPPLAEYAPYAALVWEVLLFFYLAGGKSLISLERASNKVDLAYLFYLPFCMVFTSCDRLHERCTPLFMRENQEFVWGSDLKSDLREIDAHFDKLPEHEKARGIYHIAKGPPDLQGSVTASLWDRFLGSEWRTRASEPAPLGGDSESVTPADIHGLYRADSVSPEEQLALDKEDVDAILLTRKVRLKRGKWWQVPSDIDEQAADSTSRAVLEACEAADFRPEHPDLGAVLSDFSSLDWDYGTAREMVAETIGRVWRDAPTELQAEAVTTHLLAQLANRPDHLSIVESLIQDVESLLGLALTRAESLRRTLHTFQ